MPSLRCTLPSARLALTIVAAAAVTVAGVAPAPATAATRRGYERTVGITFPVKGRTSYGESYHTPRSGGRVHQGTDVMAPKMRRIFAVRGGIVCYASGIDGPMPSYGYMLTICGNDGLTYRYLHLNNDTPGTDDGKGGIEHAYARRARPGAKVVRGQHIGWVGDSGNAEATAPHLHFEIHDPLLRDRRIRRSSYDRYRLNPYYSLKAAERRNDYPGNHFPRPR